MSDMPRTLQDVFDSIVQERGGSDNFSPLQLIAARGLTRCLNSLNEGDVSKASAIEVLQGMLPAKPQRGYLDPKKCTDADLDVLIEMLERCRSDGEPDEFEVREQQLLDMVDTWQSRCSESNRLLESERMLRASASDECVRLRALLDKRLELVEKVMGHDQGVEPETSRNAPLTDCGPSEKPSEKPSSAPDIRGNGSAAISAPLHERYPFLGDVGPVGKF